MNVPPKRGPKVEVDLVELMNWARSALPPGTPRKIVPPPAGEKPPVVQKPMLANGGISKSQAPLRKVVLPIVTPSRPVNLADQALSKASKPLPPAIEAVPPTDQSAALGQELEGDAQDSELRGDEIILAGAEESAQEGGSSSSDDAEQAVDMGGDDASELANSVIEGDELTDAPPVNPARRPLPKNSPPIVGKVKIKGSRDMGEIRPIPGHRIVNKGKKRIYLCDEENNCEEIDPRDLPPPTKARRKPRNR